MTRRRPAWAQQAIDAIGLGVAIVRWTWRFVWDLDDRDAPGLSRTGACQRAPYGWRCTREPGHSGPCAAERVRERTHPRAWDVN